MSMESIGKLQIENAEGEKVALESLWRATPVVLVFVRHFG